MLYRMFEKIIASLYLLALHFCKKFTILYLIINYNFFLSRYLNLHFYFLAIMYFWWQYLIISILMQSLIWYLSLKNIFLYLKYLQFISKFFFDFFCLFILHIFRVKFPISFVRRSSRLTSRKEKKNLSHAMMQRELGCSLHCVWAPPSVSTYIPTGLAVLILLSAVSTMRSECHGRLGANCLLSINSLIDLKSIFLQ